MKRQKTARIPTGGQSAPLAIPFACLDLQVPPPVREQNAISEQPLPEQPPTSAPQARKSQGTVLLRRETAHRHGGTVIALMDFSQPHNQKELLTLAADLKKHCCTGGTVKNARIEIQGDLLPRIKARLQALGYTPRGS